VRSWWGSSDTLGPTVNTRYWMFESLMYQMLVSGRGILYEFSKDDGFMCSQCDWNEIKVLCIEMKSNNCDWEIDPCNLVCSFDWIVYIIKFYFSLTYSFSCFVSIAMIVLCTWAYDYIGAGEPRRL